MLYSVLLLAVSGLTVLSVMSCRTQKSASRLFIRIDTLSQVSTEYETQETVMQAVPGDTLSLTLPMSEIRSLPAGAVFTKKAGRTRLTVKLNGEAVVAEAGTDSIGRETRRYERKSRDRLSKRDTATAYSRASTKENRPNNHWALWLLAGVAGAACATTVINKLFK